MKKKNNSNVWKSPNTVQKHNQPLAPALFSPDSMHFIDIHIGYTHVISVQRMLYPCKYTPIIVNNEKNTPKIIPGGA